MSSSDTRQLRAAGNEPVFVVDDEPIICDLLAEWLGEAGHEVLIFASGADCLAALTRRTPAAICLDLNMPGLSGFETLQRIRSTHPHIPVIILTADSSVTSVVETMQAGAYDYLPKPLDPGKVITTLRNATERHEMSLRLSALEREARGGYPGIIGESEAMRQLFRQIDRVTASDITVLIRGESGTGKELVARAIHDHSGRCSGPFVALNCAAVPEALLESELFGHEKGAFTGADNRRIGKFEQADGGTLFLDEVAELSQPLQAKLLRAIQERCFQRVGGVQDVRSDFRLLAATHRDLVDEVKAGRFREDIYFRLAVFELTVPPLREREGDVALLARHFIDQHRGEREVDLSEAAVVLLHAHAWPGNVRELQNAIQHALVVADRGRIEPGHLPLRLKQATGAIQAVVPAAAIAAVKQATPLPAPEAGAGSSAGEPQLPPLSLEALERLAITQAYRRHDGNVAAIARELEIGRTTLYKKLKKYDLR